MRDVAGRLREALDLGDALESPAQARRRGGLEGGLPGRASELRSLQRDTMGAWGELNDELARLRDEEKTNDHDDDHHDDEVDGRPAAEGHGPVFARPTSAVAPGASNGPRAGRSAFTAEKIPAKWLTSPLAPGQGSVHGAKLPARKPAAVVAKKPERVEPSVRAEARAEARVRARAAKVGRF